MDDKGFEARYYRADKDKRVTCLLCPRNCSLKEGQRGVCQVRQNREGILYLTTYGSSSGFCIDPIEKKPLHHFYPGSRILSFGTTGCNLTCSFCQNWSISKSNDLAHSVEQATPEKIAKRAMDLGCTSIAFTYNDPVIYLEYAVDVAKVCREHGIKTVAVTAGYISAEPCREFFLDIDAANVDIKAFSDRFYRKLCSAALEPVLETLLYIKKETSVWLELTCLLIPGENDDPTEIESMSNWIVEKLGPDVPLHFSAFHPSYKMLDHPKTPETTLVGARKIAMKQGLNHVYTGNVDDPKGGSTFCPSCKALLIERDWYNIGTYSLIETNRCPKCSTPLAGHFSSTPGNWGNRRERVEL